MNVDLDDVKEILFRVRTRVASWRARFRLGKMKRQFTHITIEIESRHHTNLLVQERHKRRETPTHVYYMLQVLLKPEVLTWIVKNARSDVHSQTIPDGGLCLFFKDPNDAVAFRMRWM